MFQKIQTWLKSKEEQLKKKQELLKAQQYYKIVRAGGMFIQFIQEDMKKNKEQVNRHIRRRMEKELIEKGTLTPEIVNYYQQKIDWVLMNINQKLNPPKIQPQNKDGVQVRTTPPPTEKK